MKRIISNVMLVAAAATAFFSCQKQEVIVPENSQEVNGLVFSSEKPAFDDETKTEWTGSTIQWSKGDKIRVAYTCDGVWQNEEGNATADEAEGEKTARLYASTGLDAAKEVATFVVPGNFKGKEEGIYQFYGIYPSTLTSSTTISYAPSVTIDVPSEQTPAANSFDAAADVMVAQSDTYNGMPKEGDNNGMISLKWSRLVAHGHLTLKALAVDGQEKIESIVLTANAEADMVGKHYVDFETQDVEKATESATNIITIDGTNLSIDAGGNVSFWASFLPCTWTSLTVEVETNKASYTREINLSSNQKSFLKNARNTLAIGMATATRIAKETPATDYSGSYVIVAKRNSEGMFYYLTGVDCGASTKRFVAELAGETCPTDVEDLDDTHKWEVSKSGDAYLVTCVSGGQISWTSGNSAFLADTGLPFEVAENEDGTFTFKYAASDGDRYISLNNTTGNNYFALYKSGQAMNLYLLPVTPDTTPSVNLEKEELELTSEESEGTIKVYAKNIASIEVRALVEEGSQDESDWLVAEYDEANSCVTYYAPANDSEEARTAYIEVYCLDADDNEVVAGVNVTQEGKVVVDTNFEEGDYWIIGVEDGTSRVMLPLASSASYGYASSEVITDNRTFAKNAFTFEAVEGGFNIKASDGRYYSTQEGYKSFQISNTPSVWTISVQNDGTCLIADASTGKTIKYGDGTYTTFGVYAETDSNTGVYPILVKADNPLLVELASIAVSGQTSSYVINGTFEFDGVVTATYNDGTTKTVAPTSVSSPDMTKAGNPEVTVTYIEGAITKTTTYTIFVVDPNAGDDLGIPSTTACYTLDTTNSANKGSNNSYTGNCDVTCNGIIWNVTGNATMNPWRVGGKSLTNVDRNVYTKTAYPTALSKIEFVSGTMNVSSWNSLKLQYSTNSDFSDAVTITASSVGASQTIPFAPEGGFPANCYFRFVLNVTVSGSSNKYIQVNQIKFYGYEN